MGHARGPAASDQKKALDPRCGERRTSLGNDCGGYRNLVAKGMVRVGAVRQHHMKTWMTFPSAGMLCTLVVHSISTPGQQADGLTCGREAPKVRVSASDARAVVENMSFGARRHFPPCRAKAMVAFLRENPRRIARRRQTAGDHSEAAADAGPGNPEGPTCRNQSPRIISRASLAIGV